MAGKNATPQLVASITKEWGFDKPLPEQYATMMKKVFTGELISYNSQANVDERNRRRGFPRRSRSASAPAMIWMFFGVLFGYISATRAGSLTDRALTVLAVIGISIPVFWLAAIFLYFLTYKIELFPASGYVALTENPLEWADHLILPWITVAVLSAASTAGCCAPTCSTR